MDIENEVLDILGNPENQTLEYKAVLPPARNVGQMICGFANAEGGFLILGVSDSSGKPIVTGLSEDFHANVILNKAIELLSPKPQVFSQSIYKEGKKVFAIKIDKSITQVSIEGRVFKRVDEYFLELNPSIKKLTPKDYIGLRKLSDRLILVKKSCTGAMAKFIDHYLSVINICADLNTILYPISPTIPTTNPEGKILMRILFSSCADNFETYLSDLLYEIYLANPATLKSKQQVTIKEVLDCADIQEFIIFYAKKKLSKLQRGSVKGFISENEQISQLKAIDEAQQEEIEKILQIRHLYAHKNGIVDDKFIYHFGNAFKLNEEHQLALDAMIAYIEYLADAVHRIDSAAISEFKLSTI